MIVRACTRSEAGTLPASILGVSPYRPFDRAARPEPEDDREESVFVTSIIVIALAVAAFQRVSHGGGAFDAIETLAWLVAIVLLVERALRARAAAGSRGTSTRPPPTSTG
ncbi:MAG: hypothetical protein IPJ34_03885 [Myxococcales bacterium]|nr:hypothetical protein [Myxococcales bacterium]